MKDKKSFAKRQKDTFAIHWSFEFKEPLNVLPEHWGKLTLAVKFGETKLLVTAQVKSDELIFFGTDGLRLKKRSILSATSFPSAFDFPMTNPIS